VNPCTFGLAAAAVAAFSPTICNASPETAAMNICARAFVDNIAPGRAAAPRYKLDYRGSLSGASIAYYFPTKSTFDLEAHDPKTGAVLARARCSTDARGAVVALSFLPLGDKNVTFADRL
jgi:hypothetical protein